MSSTPTTPGAPGPGAQVRAAVLLVLYGVFLVLATPGMDNLKKDALRTRGEQDALAEMYPPWIAALGIRVAEWNRTVRRPLASALSVVERPFLINQDWGVFDDGPPQVQRLRILIDGQIVYQTLSEEHTWLAPQLRNRHLRPLVDAFVSGGHGKDFPGLVGWLCDEALRTHPGMRRLEVLAMWGPWPGDELTVHRRAVCAAPSFEPQLDRERP